jgi:hypothetical protein
LGAGSSANSVVDPSGASAGSEEVALVTRIDGSGIRRPSASNAVNASRQLRPKWMLW